MAKVPALVLPVSAAAGVEPVVFPGFPGRFVPGDPVEVSVLAAAAGVPPADLLEQADALGLRLERVKVEGGQGPLPAVDNHEERVI